MSGIGPISPAKAAKVTALAAAANAATIVTQVNAILTALKNAGYMVAETYAPLLKSMGPLSYWRLGESVPGTGTAVDEMGVHNGTYVASPATAPGLLAGDGNPGVTLNGSTQLINFGTTHFLSGLTNSSIVVWFSSGAFGTADRTLYSERPGTGNDIFKFALEITTGRPSFTYRDDAAALDQVYPTAGTYANNGIHCFVMTKAGTACILYADGAPVKNATLTASNTFTAADRVTQIGQDYPDGNSYFPGVLDEVAIFTRALTPTEVAALYAAGTTP
jgi:hypothetical protein